MEAWIFFGLVSFALLCVTMLMLRLRFETEPMRFPVWIAALLLAVSVACLAVSIATASWWNVASFTLLTTTATALLISGIRWSRSTR